MRAEDVEQLVASNGISINGLRQAQDHNGLESDATKNTAVKETLSCDGDASNLSHLGPAVGHPLVGHVGHLDAKLLHQLEVDVGGAGCWDAWGLQDREGPSLYNQNVFLNSSSIFQTQGFVVCLHRWFKLDSTMNLA